MKHDSKVYLQDILSSIQNIYEYVDNIDFSKYTSNRMIKHAVERNFEIIGEAINNLLKVEGSNFPISDARKIISFRNQLSHGYSSVSDKLVWKIIEEKLPTLHSEVVELLEKGIYNDG
jgi:uncharacterized protein with HEPN domain